MPVADARAVYPHPLPLDNADEHRDGAKLTPADTLSRSAPTCGYSTLSERTPCLVASGGALQSTALSLGARKADVGQSG